MRRFWAALLAEHPAAVGAQRRVTALAAVVASVFGDPVRQKLTVGGDGGGVLDLDSRGAITLTLTRLATAGPPAAQVTDALAGRAPTCAVLSDLPASTRTALSHLADLFNTPVERARVVAVLGAGRLVVADELLAAADPTAGRHPQMSLSV
jgi:hypothetical protein